MSKKLDEIIEAYLISQFLRAINSAITAKLLPTLQNSLETQTPGSEQK